MLSFYLTLIDTEAEKSKFEQLYLIYRQMMFFVAKQILEDSYLAEYAVHQAFLKIIDHFDKIGEIDCPKTQGFIVTMRFLSDNYTQPQTLEIWAVELETVQKELEEYANTENISDLSISIQPARYSRADLLPINDAISKFADERYEQDGTLLINYSTVLKDFIYISAPQKTEELNNFIKEHGFQDYVETEVAIVIVPNA